MSCRKNMTPLSESEMLAAEQGFQKLAAMAGRKAYRMSLEQTGSAVVKTSTGQMVVRKRDGSVTVIKNLPMGRRVKVGTVLKRAA